MHFMPYLPEDFQKNISDGSYFSNVMGFSSPFEAWVMAHKGQLNGVHWLCSMLMDDCSESSPPMQQPYLFMKQVRWMYNRNLTSSQSSWGGPHSTKEKNE